jgi:hypothetical protein
VSSVRRTIPGLAWGFAFLGFTSSCASGGTSPSTFVALVYGRVVKTGNPAPGLSVKADVFTTTCPASALDQTSTQSAQTGSDGRYRILLTSSIPDKGQCLVLTVTGAQPELHTLDQTAFSANFPGPATDSVEVNVSLP